MKVVIVEGEGAVLGVNLGRPIVTNGAFATRLFSNYFEDLFVILCCLQITKVNNQSILDQNSVQTYNVSVYCVL